MRSGNNMDNKIWTTKYGLNQTWTTCISTDAHSQIIKMNTLFKRVLKLYIIDYYYILMINNYVLFYQNESQLIYNSVVKAC